MKHWVRCFLLLSAALALALPAGTTLAVQSDRESVDARICPQFPLTAQAEAGDRDHASHALHLAPATFLSERFADAIRLDHPAHSVSLRPIAAPEVRASRFGSRTEYRNAFRGVDALRNVTDDVMSETLFIRDRGAARSIAYELTTFRGSGFAVAADRGVRFVSETGRSETILSAPVLVDAAGRPSNLAEWRVVPGPEGRSLIRLHIRDGSLHYPVAAFYATAGTLSRRPFLAVPNATGSLSGFVTAAGSGDPIDGAFLLVYDGSGAFAGYTLTDATGAYSVGDLSTGNHYVLVMAEGYVTQLYSEIACPDAECDVTTGTPVGVVDGSNTPNIGIAMNRTGVRIAGRVTDSAALPLESVVVIAYDASGIPRASGIADANGEYQVHIDQPGTYYARTFNSLYPGLVNQLYSGLDCTACDPTTGTAIALTQGQSRGDIDFSLRAGGRIAGTVSDTGTNRPLAADLLFYGAGGEAVSFATTDAAGNYISFNGLASGNYYVRASAVGYLSEVYDDVPCASCDVTTGTAVSVTVGQTTSSIDLALTLAEARASGTVKDAATNTALEGVYVGFFDATGAEVAFTATGPDGSYIIELPGAGTYFARTFVYLVSGYVDQLYSAIDCSGCVVTSGTPIEVVTETPTAGVDFRLARDGGSITGLVRDGSTLLPISSAFLVVYSASGNVATVGMTDANGNYTLLHGLTNGDYYVIAFAFDYAAELYDDLACSSGCDPTMGTAVAVTRGVVTSGIDFDLATQSCAIAVEPATLPDGSVGASYPASTITSPDGVAPVTFQISDGQLPPGLALDSGTGVISGTPTDPGDFTFSVTAQDANGCTGGRTYSIHIGGNTSSTLLTVSATAITYGDTITLTATVTPSNADGTVSFFDGFVLIGTATLSGGTASLDVSTLTAGVHDLVAEYNGSVDFSGSVSPAVQVTVAKATPVITWPAPAPIVYGTALSGTELNATASTAGTFVYTPAAGTVLNAGTHTLMVAFTPDDADNYTTVSVTVTLEVLKATPLFSDLSNPTIVVGAASTTISGKITAGALVPPGSVVITLNSVSMTAAIGADGSFSTTFDTTALQLVSPGYTIDFAYAGSTNFQSASATSLLIVTYQTTGGPLSASPKQSGSVIPVRVFVRNAAGLNLSSSSLPVTAYGVRPTSSATWIPVTSTGNFTTAFTYQNAQGGSYLYNLDTDGLVSGQYVFGFTVGADPTVHTVSFTIR